MAPFNEQKRIVEKLELLLSELDKATQALQAVQEKLKNYRRAVLKAAVEGELSRAWREENKEGLEPAERLLERILAERRKKWEEDELAKMRAKGKEPKDDKWKEKYKEPEGVDVDGLPELPDGWEWALLDQLLSSLRNGISKKPDEDSGLPILRISAVRPLLVDLEDTRFLPHDDDAFNDYVLKAGDLLFTRYNGNPDFVGVCGVVRKSERLTVYPDKLIKGEVASDEVRPMFLEIALNVGESRKFVSQRIRSSAGQNGVSGSNIKLMPVPLPSVEEQDYIIEEADRHLSIVENLRMTIEAKLQHSENLRQSLLKKAFSGLLVPQDPNDEPASVLLERIRAEREAATAGKKGKRGEAKGSTAAEQPKLFGG